MATTGDLSDLSPSCDTSAITVCGPVTATSSNTYSSITVQECSETKRAISEPILTIQLSSGSVTVDFLEVRAGGTLNLMQGILIVKNLTLSQGSTFIQTAGSTITVSGCVVLDNTTLMLQGGNGIPSSTPWAQAPCIIGNVGSIVAVGANGSCYTVTKLTPTTFDIQPCSPLPAPNNSSIPTAPNNSTITVAPLVSSPAPNAAAWVVPVVIILLLIIVIAVLLYIPKTRKKK